MAVLDPATVLALAIQCAPVRVDPGLVLAIARVESGLDPRIVHVNANGSRDIGLMQVNEANFSWLGLNEQKALDPCQSIRAGIRVLTATSEYNTGKPLAGFDNGYVGKVIAAYRNSKDAAGIKKAQTAVQEVTPTSIPQCDAPHSDVWGQEACRQVVAAASHTCGAPSSDVWGQQACRETEAQAPQPREGDHE